MFKDSDLLGLPLRLVLGERDYDESGELELKIRSTGESIKVKKDAVVEKVNQLLKELGKEC